MRTADCGEIYVTLSQKYICDDTVHGLAALYFLLKNTTERFDFVIL